MYQFSILHIFRHSSWTLLWFMETYHHKECLHSYFICLKVPLLISTVTHELAVNPQGLSFTYVFGIISNFIQLYSFHYNTKRGRESITLMIQNFTPSSLLSNDQMILTLLRNNSFRFGKNYNILLKESLIKREKLKSVSTAWMSGSNTWDSYWAYYAGW